MKKAIYFLMDVFTNQHYSGNQLAIFPDATQIPDDLLPKIARELNLSETVYLYPKTHPDADFKMRIFTPASELPTAGHPTIGTSIFLARKIDHENNEIYSLTLEQKIGNIPVQVQIVNNLPVKATMEQPLPNFGEIFEDRQVMAELIGLNEEDLLEFPVQLVGCGVPYVIIPVKSIDLIKKIGFRLDRYNELKKSFGGAFIYAFTPSGETKDGKVHGRMFAPEAGILEDPATGSANGPLGCYLTKYGILQSPYLSEQGFEMGRPSIIEIEIDKGTDENIRSVKVGGEAVLTGKGEIYLTS